MQLLLLLPQRLAWEPVWRERMTSSQALVWLLPLHRAQTSSDLQADAVAAAAEGGMGASVAGTNDVIPGIGGAAAAPRLAAFDMDPSVPGACSAWHLDTGSAVWQSPSSLSWL